MNLGLVLRPPDEVTAGRNSAMKYRVAVIDRDTGEEIGDIDCRSIKPTLAVDEPITAEIVAYVDAVGALVVRPWGRGDQISVG